MNKKYIIFDMDDTLLTKEKQVTPFTLKVLKELQNQGHYIVINTARSKAYNQEYFDIIRPDFAILNGGSQIIDKNERNVFLLPIEKDSLNGLLKELKTMTKNVSIQTEDTFFTTDMTYKNQNPKPFSIDKEFTHPALKLLAFLNSEEEGLALAKKYNVAYVSYFNGPCKRMNNIGASKFNGILHLLELTNGKIEDTIAFGDDLGDLEMIEKCGVGVLMCNAKEDLLKNATTISDYSNNQNGVARFLKKYFNL